VSPEAKGVEGKTGGMRDGDVVKRGGRSREGER